jgi:hypothetical protein
MCEDVMQAEFDVARAFIAFLDGQDVFRVFLTTANALVSSQARRPERVSDLEAAFTLFQLQTRDVVAKGLSASQVMYRMAGIKCIKRVRRHASKVVWLKHKAKEALPSRVPVLLKDPKTELSLLFAILPMSLVLYIRQLVPDFKVMLHSIMIERGQAVTLLQGDQRPPIRLDVPVDIEAVCGKAGNPLQVRGSTAIGDSLHTCRFKVDAATGAVTGITIRVARVIQGVSDVVQDLVMSAQNIVVLGFGKTTFLRDIVAKLSAQMVIMVIDTRGELGGPGKVAHPSLGHVRRVVPGRGVQASAIREAITHHAVDGIVVDELCDVEEFAVVQEYARVRNVRVIAGCPHTTLDSLPSLVSFDVAVEILSSVRYRVFHVGSGTHQLRLRK